MTCDRCGEKTSEHRMSYFDTSRLCPRCQNIEEAHPDFEHARSVEIEHVRSGDTKFEGVGAPADLIQQSIAARKATRA